jgi:ankyrin repeat protein
MDPLVDLQTFQTFFENVGILALISSHEGGESILFQAVFKGKFDILDWLWSNAVVNKNFTLDLMLHRPLWVAAYYNHPDIVRRLLENRPGEYPVNVDACDTFGSTAVFVACQNGCVECFDALRGAGADLHLTTANGMTCFSVACQNGFKPIVQKMILEDTLTQLPMHDGTTPLMMTALMGRNEIAALLLENGADVNALRKNGTSALHLAASNGNAALCAMLIQAGADVSAVSFGSTASEKAARAGYTQVAKTIS